ncbi:MAG: HAMP domain-containing sensor histidine kinase [Legionellaceae bacterium]|nr:HAMP domain-containing sensor histidine kinase [Legionellaceae bacterium]
MIKLLDFFVENYDAVIEIRNKLYCLVIDLNMGINTATRSATRASEILHRLLNMKTYPKVNIGFAKRSGYYHLHINIFCKDSIYQQLNTGDTFRDVTFTDAESSTSHMDLKLKINDKDFVPNDSFLQAERERLIQQSGTSMIKEIRRKNEELTKALTDLKTSSTMIQTEKMRALGNLTAGVAHEINNPMMGILNYVQYAIKHTEEDDRKYRPLVDAEKEIKRCQTIIDNLLTFSRMKAEGEELGSKGLLSVLCDRVLQLHSYKLRASNVTVIKDYPDNEPEIVFMSNKMQQVILNFVTNAIDAMKESDKRELTLSIINLRDIMKLEIQDTGSGIDDETLDKIFEPFFTTKQTGQGTGLGLSMSQSIIEEHKGSLECKSKPGVGTCFIISLPAFAT